MENRKNGKNILCLFTALACVLVMLLCVIPMAVSAADKVIDADKMVITLPRMRPGADVFSADAVVLPEGAHYTCTACDCKYRPRDKLYPTTRFREGVPNQIKLILTPEDGYAFPLNSKEIVTINGKSAPDVMFESGGTLVVYLEFEPEDTQPPLWVNGVALTNDNADTLLPNAAVAYDSAATCYTVTFNSILDGTKTRMDVISLKTGAPGDPVG